MFAAALALSLCFEGAQAYAQATLDPGFVPPARWAAWEPGVSALAIQPDAKVVVSAGNAVVRLNADGSPDVSFARVDLDGSPSQIVVLPDGKILIGGNQFSTANGQPARNLLRLNADGSVDQSFLAAAIPDGSARFLGLAVQADGRILVAGPFAKVGITASSCVARLDANGAFDPSFVSPFSASSSCPGTIAVRGDGKILVGGSFAYPSTSDSRSTLLRLNADGSFDADLSAVSGLVENVNVLHPLPDGRLLAAGNGNGQRVVRLNADDSLDAGFDVSLTNTVGVGMVFSLYGQPNGKVVIGGLFTKINGQLRNYLGRVDADGNVDPTFNASGTAINTYFVSSLAAQSDGRILVGGTFTGVDNIERAGLARLLVPDPATERLGFGATHQSLQWQRGGAGIELGQVRFESSTDGQSWTPLGAAQWTDGAWQLTPASPLPAQGSLWLKASGASNTGAGHAQGTYSGSRLVSTRQIRATVTPSAAAGGSVAPATPQYIDTGSAASFTITADPGQQVLSVGGSCRGHLVGNVYTLDPVDADCTVVANFTSSANVVVTPSAGGGGTITPASPQAVTPGQPASFTLTPETGYAITDVGGSCGGSLAGAVFTTVPLSANCSVEAHFAITTKTVTATASGGHGTIAPATQTLNYGQVATLSVVPESGYNAFVSGCGGTLSGTTYTTAALTDDCAVQAHFESFSAAQTSVQLKLAVANGDDACVVGTPTLAVRRAELEKVNLCVVLNNQSGRDLDRMTMVRGALRGDFNAYEPWLLAQGSLASGSTFSNFYDLWVPKESTDVTVTWAAHAASAPAPSYSYDDGAAFVAVDVSTLAGATDLGLVQPRDNRGVHLPFAFNFFGIPTDVVCVSNDGALIVTSEICDTWSDRQPKLLIAPSLRTAADPFSGYEGGAVHTAVLGQAPNRRFAVEWRDKQIVGAAGGGVTFQAFIDEGSSAITFQYVTMASGTTADNGRGAFAGLKLGFFDAPFAYPNDGTLTDGKAVRWTPSAQSFTTLATASAHITVLEPDLSVQPVAVNAQAAVGGTATVALTLGNQGNEPLVWTAAAAAGGRGFEIAQAFAAPMVRAMPAAPAARTPPQPIAQSGATHATSTVPAVAHAWQGINNSRLVSLDATAPTALSPTAAGSVSVWAIHAGGFVDNDFRQLYLINGPGCDDNGCWNAQLQRTDPATVYSDQRVLYGGGAAPMAGQLWRGLRWDGSSNTLFGVASDYSATTQPPYRSDLYTIDPITGVVAHVARIDDLGAAGTALADIAIDDGGNLYGIEMGEDTLIAIDKATGHIHPVGPSGLDVGYYSLQSMDFDHSTGELYYTTWTNSSTVGQQMFTLDASTGAAHLVGTVGDGQSGLRALSIAKPGSACVNADQVPWLSLDHASGTVAPAQSDAVALAFDATGLQPGTYRANLCIGNNTPYKSQVTVPVTLTVGAGDRIFANGFEPN